MHGVNAMICHAIAAWINFSRWLHWVLPVVIRTRAASISDVDLIRGTHFMPAFVVVLTSERLIQLILTPCGEQISPCSRFPSQELRLTM